MEAPLTIYHSVHMYVLYINQSVCLSLPLLTSYICDNVVQVVCDAFVPNMCIKCCRRKFGSDLLPQQS